MQIVNGVNIVQDTKETLIGGIVTNTDLKLRSKRCVTILNQKEKGESMKSEFDVANRIKELFVEYKELGNELIKEDIHQVESPTLDKMADIKSKIKALEWVIN